MSTRSDAAPSSVTTWRSPSSVTPVARVRCTCTRSPSGTSATIRRSTHPRYTLCSRLLGHDEAVTARSSAASAGPRSSGSSPSSAPSRRSRAQSQNDGPGRIGPSQTTVSSVNIVTSAAIEFIASSADCSWRQIRPAPAGYGSIRWTSSSEPGRSSGRLAARRSRIPAPRGPAPTIAIAGRWVIAPDSRSPAPPCHRACCQPDSADRWRRITSWRRPTTTPAPLRAGPTAPPASTARSPPTSSPRSRTPRPVAPRSTRAPAPGW